MVEQIVVLIKAGQTVRGGCVDLVDSRLVAGLADDAVGHHPDACATPTPPPAVSEPIASPTESVGAGARSLRPAP